MADYFVTVTTTSQEILGASDTRRRSRIINYGDSDVWLGVGVDAVVNSGVVVAPYGGYYEVSYEQGTYTTVALYAIHNDRGPKQVGIENEEWDVPNNAPLAQAPDVTFFNKQPGDAVIYAADTQQFNNGPILFGQAWELDGSIPIGLYKEPFEIPSDWKLLAVRMRSKSVSGACVVNIHSALFGQAFMSIVGSGTKPSLDVGVSPWFEDTVFSGWRQTAAGVASWLWLEVVSCSLDSLMVSLSFQRTAVPVA